MCNLTSKLKGKIQNLPLLRGLVVINTKFNKRMNIYIYIYIYMQCRPWGKPHKPLGLGNPPKGTTNEN